MRDYVKDIDIIIVRKYKIFWRIFYFLCKGFK